MRLYTLTLGIFTNGINQPESVLFMKACELSCWATTKPLGWPKNLVSKQFVRVLTAHRPSP